MLPITKDGKNVELEKLSDEKLTNLQKTIEHRKTYVKNDGYYSFEDEGAFERYADFVTKYYGMTPTELAQIEHLMTVEEENKLAQTSDVEERQKLKADLRKQRINALDAFAKVNFFDEDFNQNALKAIDDIKTLAEKEKKNRTDHTVLEDVLKDFAIEADNKYRNGITDLITQCKQWFKDYAKAFNDFDYTDPEQENLKRQDFNTKLAGMDKGDLAEFITDEMPTANLTTYQFDKLLAVTKGDDNLYKDVKDFMRDNHIGKEYVTTNQWKNVQDKISRALLLKDQGFVFDKDNGAHYLLDIDQHLLRNYRVSDPDQLAKFKKQQAKRQDEIANKNMNEFQARINAQTKKAQAGLQ